MKDSWKKNNRILIKKKLKDKIEKAYLQNCELVKPEKKIKIEIRHIILDFIKEKKRVIYGGSAINTFISLKDSSDKIYDIDWCEDIEFYSPKPLDDLIELCNILFNKGYQNVEGREAMHEETFTISVEYFNFCDITYMSDSMIRKNIQTKDINGIRYVSPEFLMVDMFRVFSNPLHDYPFRLEKVYNRYLKLEKYYYNPPLKPQYCGLKDISRILISIRNQLYDKFILNNTDLILCGARAYKYYLFKSDYLKKNKSAYNPINDCHLVIIVENIKETTEKCLKHLEKYDDFLTIREYVKFFQFYDRSLVIEYQDTPIITIMGYNDICTQYHKVMVDNNNFIQIAGFDYIMKFMLSMVFRNLPIMEKKNHYRCMAYYLIEMRDYYLKKKKLTGLENNDIFSQFFIKCKWITLSGQYLNRQKKKKRFIERKGPVTFEYRPAMPGQYKNVAPEKKFGNASGNQILRKEKLYIQNDKYLPNNIKTQN